MKNQKYDIFFFILFFLKKSFYYNWPWTMVFGDSEVQRRKDLNEEIKQFSIAFASRQKSLTSIHGEFKSKIES